MSKTLACERAGLGKKKERKKKEREGKGKNGSPSAKVNWNLDGLGGAKNNRCWIDQNFRRDSRGKIFILEFNNSRRNNICTIPIFLFSRSGFIFVSIFFLCFSKRESENFFT